MGTHWYELVRQLQGAAELERGRSGKCLESSNVSGVLAKAVEVARKDSDWNSSGLPESLQRALDLCDKQGPAAAVAAALRLLDFKQIVEAKSSTSPKGSPQQGPRSESLTELHVPKSQSQLRESSRTSVPVITIKRSSQSRPIPTTTTIVLQPSFVQSDIAQRDDQAAAQSQSEYALHRQSARGGEAGRLHVLKSKNGRSNGSALLVSSKPPPTAIKNKPSCIVRDVQNGQRPLSPSEAAVHFKSNSNSNSSDHCSTPSAERAGPPPTNGTLSSTVTTNSAVSSGQSVTQTEQDTSSSKGQVKFSPFQAEEAQSHEHQQLESRHSNSDSDKSCESAGGSKRNLQQSAAESPAAEPRSTKRLKSLERVLSVGTVLQCVDKRCDRDGPFDAAVGQRPATVHEVTEGATPASRSPPGSNRASEGKLELQGSRGERGSPPAATMGGEKQATVSIVMSADSAQRLRAQAAESGLHQSDSGLARALGDNPQVVASVIGPSISGQLSPLAFPPLPLSSPPPLIQLPMHIPPLKVEPLHGGVQAGKSEGKLADLRQGEGEQLLTAHSAELEQGSSQTALWSGKVKHRLGASTVDLFYMTALIPEKYLEQFPPTLFVTSLATQKDVKLGRHFVMRCRLDFLTEKQLGKLQMLAQGKVVAICKLQHSTVTLVPYYDKHRTLRVVGFMLADE